MKTIEWEKVYGVERISVTNGSAWPFPLKHLHPGTPEFTRMRAVLSLLNPADRDTFCRGYKMDDAEYDAIMEGA